jgi:hypothetical protein
MVELDKFIETTGLDFTVTVCVTTVEEQRALGAIVCKEMIY